MRRINIALLDSGIQTKVLHSLTGYKKRIDNLWLNNGCARSYIEPLSEISHGTICAALLIEYLGECNALDYIGITSLSIANPEGEQTLDELSVALDWCVIHHFDLILMSVGLKSYIHATQLIPIIERAKPRLTMIAAASNDGQITYPACFGDVIGVKTTRGTVVASDGMDVIQSPYDGIEIEAHIVRPHVLRLCNDIYSIDYPVSNSFTVPFVASKVSKIMLKSSSHLSKTALLSAISPRGQKMREQIGRCSVPPCDIPIVLAPYRRMDGSSAVEMLSSIVQRFMENGYSCACLTDFCSESIFEKSIYALPSDDVRRWMVYYRSVLAYTSLILILIDENSCIINDIGADLILHASKKGKTNAMCFIDEAYDIITKNMVP